MGDVVYRSRIELTERQGPNRLVTMPGGEQVWFGTHGEIAEHYGRKPGDATPHSATLDYVVAAALG